MAFLPHSAPGRHPLSTRRGRAGFAAAQGHGPGNEDGMDKFGIGQPVRRKEDVRLLTGRGTYTDDIDRPGQAHAFVLRSPTPTRASSRSTPRRRGRRRACSPC